MDSTSSIPDTTIDVLSLDAPQCHATELSDATVQIDTLIHQEPTHIPTEILDLIFSRLSLPDIKSVRLVSKHWKLSASSILFKTFILRVDRSDVERLDLIEAADPNFVAGIKTLRFDVGKLGLIDMVGKLAWLYRCYFNANQSPENGRSDIRHHGIIEPAQLETLKGEAIAEYALWNHCWHLERQEWRTKKSLKRLMDKLASVDCIDITTQHTTLKNILNVYVWFYLYDPGFNPQCLRNFLNVLEVLSVSEHTIRSFSHDGLPMVLFRFDQSTINNMARPLRFLTSLHLTTYHATYPEPRYWKGFGQFITAIPHLKSLRFGSTYFGHKLGTFEQTQLIKWYIPLWQLLGSYTWNNLESLRLDGLVLCETGLMELLTRHHSTLRDLELTHIALWSGTFRNLLTGMKNALALKRFRLWGATRAIHSEHDFWNLYVPLDLGRETYSEELKSQIVRYQAREMNRSRMNADYDRESVKDRLEAFVIHRYPESWPIDPQEKDHSRRQSHSYLCRHCIQPRAEIDSFWAHQLRNSPVDDAPFDPDVHNDFLGVGEKKVICFYDEDGYDNDGYDRNGFDRAGEHFDHAIDRRHRVESPLAGVKARRMIRDELLSQIPRYAERDNLQGREVQGLECRG